MSGSVRLRVLAAVVALALVGVAFAGAWAWLELRRPFGGWEGEATVVVLEPGLDAGSMLRRLGDAGVLRAPRLARWWLGWRGKAARLQAGEYRFAEPSSAFEVLDRLERGDVWLHPVTLPEGLTLVEIAARMEQAGFGSREALIGAFRDPTPISDLDPLAVDLEGYLFPETYHLALGTDAAAIAVVLVGHFRNAIGPDYVAEAERLGMTLREAVTLASMIERETSVPEERGRISRVFHNRLERGMKLECDPTVIYALERAGREVERLTYDDLRFDSPWNTYVVERLPAGPIANPGRESLLAALRPVSGRDLFFVASPDGGHRFSETLTAHLRAVAEWRRHVRSSR